MVVARTVYDDAVGHINTRVSRCVSIDDRGRRRLVDINVSDVMGRRACRDLVDVSRDAIRHVPWAIRSRAHKPNGLVADVIFLADQKHVAPGVHSSRDGCSRDLLELRITLIVDRHRDFASNHFSPLRNLRQTNGLVGFWSAGDRHPNMRPGMIGRNVCKVC
jgi:hypothetical protein